MAQLGRQLAQKAALLTVPLVACLSAIVQPAAGSIPSPYRPVPAPGRLAHIGEVEYPFGQLSVAGNGTLYYVDHADGQIDEVTASGPRTVLSSLDGDPAPGASIAGLRGLSIAGNTIWFTAGGGLYRASITGRSVRRTGNAPGAVDLDVLADGTAFFTTDRAIFERAPGGPTERAAGGSSIDFAEQQAGPQQALGVAINPASVVGASRHVFYFANENNLYLVDNGIAGMLKPWLEFFNGELAAGPGGSIYGICNWSVCRVAGRTFRELFKLPEPINGAFGAPDAFAVSPSGDFYIAYSDQSFPAKAGIVELSPEGKVVSVVASSG